MECIGMVMMNMNAIMSIENQKRDDVLNVMKVVAHFILMRNLAGFNSTGG